MMRFAVTDRCHRFGFIVAAVLACRRFDHWYELYDDTNTCINTML